MVDIPKKTVPSLHEVDRTTLLNRIDELEKLLARKKAETRQTDEVPKLKVGTDGIPVLVEAVTEKDMNPVSADSLLSIKKDNEIINDIIDKVDKEISKDLDELIILLKDSIIEEVKTRLLNELQQKEKKTD